MYAKHIRGTGKGEHAATLGQYVTCIHGPNRSGKSALLNLLTLALDSSAEDMAGRHGVIREPGALLGLGDGGPIWSECTLSDGRVSTFRLEPGGKTKPSGPRGIFVVRDVYEKLTGSAPAARAYLLKHGANVTFESVLAQLDPSLHDVFTQMSTGISDPVKALTEVKKAAEKRTRTATSERKGAVATLGHTPLVPVDDTAVEALRVELDAAKQDWFEYNQINWFEYNQIKRQHSFQATGQRDELVAQRAQLADALTGLREALEAAPPKDMSRADDILAALRALVKVFKGIDFNACLACGQSVDSDEWWKYVYATAEALPVATEDERVALLHQGEQKLDDLDTRIALMPEVTDPGEEPDSDIPALQASYDTLVAQRAP